MREREREKKTSKVVSNSTFHFPEISSEFKKCTVVIATNKMQHFTIS
jgi:pterin-4a-carbinolamine dehydratase